MEIFRPRPFYPKVLLIGLFIQICLQPFFAAASCKGALGNRAGQRPAYLQEDVINGIVKFGSANLAEPARLTAREFTGAMETVPIENFSDKPFKIVDVPKVAAKSQQVKRQADLAADDRRLINKLLTLSEDPKFVRRAYQKGAVPGLPESRGQTDLKEHGVEVVALRIRTRQGAEFTALLTSSEQGTIDKADLAKAITNLEAENSVSLNPEFIEQVDLFHTHSVKTGHFGPLSDVDEQCADYLKSVFRTQKVGMYAAMKNRQGVPFVFELLK